MDQRDAYIDQLSQLMDINVIQGDRSQVNIFTNSGIQLVGAQAAQLSFDAVGTVTPDSLWNADPSLARCWHVTLIPPAGTPSILIQDHAIRSGTIAAYLQMRDQDLVQAQNQLDALAAGMATGAVRQDHRRHRRLRRRRKMVSTSISAGLSARQYDHRQLHRHRDQHAAYDNAGAGRRSAGFAAANTPRPRQQTTLYSALISPAVWIGRCADQHRASPVPAWSASNPSGTTLEILDDGAGNTVDVNSLSTTATVTTADRRQRRTSVIYRRLDALHRRNHRTAVRRASAWPAASQSIPSVVADPSSLVIYRRGTAAGDSTRPDFILHQLTSAAQTFLANTGIGTCPRAIFRLAHHLSCGKSSASKARPRAPPTT